MFLTAQLARLALVLSLLSVPFCHALADSLITCPGVDIVEADLKHSNSSGYYLPVLRLIVLNRTVLQDFPKPVWKFILAHECAHADPLVGDDEDAADCAAAKRGALEGWLGKTEVIQTCVHLSRSSPDGSHMPIATRCGNIRQCSGIDRPQADKVAAPAPPIKAD